MARSEILFIFVAVFTALILETKNSLFQDYGGFINQPYMNPLTMDYQIGTDVELSIRAEHLRDRDVVTKSDPVCVTSVKTSSAFLWTEIHQTEKIDNDLCPIFALKPIVSSFQASNTAIKFEIYDYDKMVNDPLGFAVTNLAELIAAGTSHLPIQKRTLLGMSSTSTESKIVINAEKLIINNDQVSMNISGTDLAKKDLMSLSDPYLEVFKQSPGDNFVLVYRTEMSAFAGHIGIKFEYISSTPQTGYAVGMPAQGMAGSFPQAGFQYFPVAQPVPYTNVGQPSVYGAHPNMSMPVQSTPYPKYGMNASVPVQPAAAAYIPGNASLPYNPAASVYGTSTPAQPSLYGNISTIPQTVYQPGVFPPGGQLNQSALPGVYPPGGLLNQSALPVVYPPGLSQFYYPRR